MKPNGWHIGIVKLWDLPKDKIYIDVKEPFKSKFIESLMKTSKTKTDIARKIRETFDDIRNFFDRGQTKSLEFIEKLIDLLASENIDEFNRESIEENISVIQAKNGKKIHNPKFPLNFDTTEGATLISAVFHDGGITKGTLCPFYRNYKPEKINYIRHCFNIVGELEFSMQNNDTKIVFPNIFGIILINGLGLESGAKTILNPTFPQFIFKSNIEVKTAFLRQAFDDEGGISLGGGKSRQIVFHQAVDVSKIAPELREKIKRYDIEEFAPNIMKGIKALLITLDIKVNKLKIGREGVSKNGRINHQWKLRITHKNNITKFNEKIGFGVLEKQKILNIAVNTYTANRLYPETYKAV